MANATLIFDFDNTLAENIDITDYDILNVIKGYKEINNTSLALDAIRAAHSDFQICLDFLDGDCVHSAYEHIIQINMRKVLNAFYKEEVINTIMLLSKKYPLFIVSGRDVKSLRLSVSNIGLDSFFQQIIGDIPYQLAKPNPAMLLGLFKNNHLCPANCIYIGDSYTDFTFARNATCKFIGAGWYRKDGKLNPDDICDIPQLLEERIEAVFNSE